MPMLPLESIVITVPGVPKSKRISSKPNPPPLPMCKRLLVSANSTRFGAPKLLFKFSPWLLSSRMAPPLTCNLAPGAVVPIPTKVSAAAPLTPLILPRTSELFWLTCASAPMAVALVRLLMETSA